jgi:hypothetical protein
MHTHSNTKSSIVLSLLAVLVVGGLISNGFALMAHKAHIEPCASPS